MVSFETVLAYAEVFLTYIQYLGLITNIDVPWPKAWLYYMEWTHFLNFDLSINLPNVPNLDYRAYYLLVVIAVPMAFAFVMLVFFKPLYVCLWFLALLISLALLAAGVILMVLPSLIPTTTNVSYQIIIIAGSVGTAICLLLLLASYMWGKANKKQNTESRNMEEEEEEEAKAAMQNHLRYRKFNISGRGVWAHLSKFLFVGIVTVLGLLCLNLIDIPSVDVRKNNPMVGFLRIIGIVFLGIASFVFLYWMMISFKSTRAIVDKVKLFIVSKFVRSLLFLLTIIYIPLTRTVFSAWNCTTLTCPEGYHFPYKDPLVSSSNVLDIRSQLIKQNEDTCQACNFIGSCPIAMQLCPETSDSRLIDDVTLSCSIILPYYAPVSALMFLGIVVGVPVMFWYLIRTHSKLLKSMQVPASATSDTDKWKFRVHATDNSGRSLYHMFGYHWRYFKVLLIIQKLILVAMTIFVFGWQTVMGVAVTLIHYTFFGFFAYTTPYVSAVMDFLGNSTSFSLGTSSMLACLLAFGIIVPDWAVGLILIMVIVLPVACIIIGFIITKKRRAKVASQEETAAVLTPRTKSAIDDTINDKTMKVISSYAILLGFLAFLGLTGTIIGFLHSMNNSKIVSPVGENWANTKANVDNQKYAEFAGYEDWNEFLSNCCCTAGKETEDIPKLEVWFCMNGRYKQRARSMTDSEGFLYDGLDLRPFCAREFSSNICGPSVESDGKYRVSLCNSNSTLSPSQFELSYLW